jgi:hypothetical protein
MTWSPAGARARRDGKRVASRIANLACRWLFGLQVHDLNWIKGFAVRSPTAWLCGPSSGWGGCRCRPSMS